MGRKRMYPFNEIRECKECKRLFVRHVVNAKGYQVGHYCGQTCRSKAQIAARNETCSHMSMDISVQEKEDDRSWKLANIPGPTAYERQLWGK